MVGTEVDTEVRKVRHVVVGVPMQTVPGKVGARERSRVNGNHVAEKRKCEYRASNPTTPIKLTARNPGLA